MNSFGVGSVLSTSFRVWGRNLIPFSVIMALIYVPLIIWTYTFTASSSHSLEDFGKQILLMSSLTIILDVFASAVITYGVVKELAGQHASLGACIAVGLKRLPAALGVGFLTILALVGGMICLIVPFFIFRCMLYVAMPASVIEKPGITGALGRSRTLTQGHKGEVFGIIFILGLIGWGVQKVEGAMFSDSLNSILWANLVVEVLLGSLGAVACAVTYSMLRNEKDGTSADDLARVFE